MQTKTVNLPHPLLEISMHLSTSLEEGEFNLEEWVSWFERTLAEKVISDPRYRVPPSLTYEEWKDKMEDKGNNLIGNPYPGIHED